MKNAIIIGASSGIGKDLALELSKRGYTVALCARRQELLEQVAAQCSSPTFVQIMDAAQHEIMRNQLRDLAEKMGGADLVIYNAGIGESSGKWEKEEPMHQINAVGFAAVANWAFNYFKRQKKAGQIVGISSVAGTRGMRHAIGYGATKAFMWNYMQGQRHKAVAEKLPITITDIRPGFIDTDMTKGQAGMFMVQTSEKAAHQIADAIEAKRSVVYITRRWWLIGKLFSFIPDFLWHKI